MSYGFKDFKSRNSGFTLVEAMVAVAVLAIVAMIGLPAMRAFIANSRLVTQTNEVLAAVQVARSEATRLNASVTFCRAAGATATTCAGGNGTNDWEHWIVLAQGRVLKRGVVTGDRVNLRASGTLTNNQIVYGADSLARTTGGALVTAALRVCSSDNALSSNHRLISLQAGGRAYVFGGVATADCDSSFT